MSDSMLEHLQMLVLTAVFNPLFLGFLVAVFFVGRILGRFIPWYPVGRLMVILFVVGLVLQLLVFNRGYDLYFMMGIPFIVGIWGASVKWSS